jgi:hypothetical protein
MVKEVDNKKAIDNLIVFLKNKKTLFKNKLKIIKDKEMIQDYKERIIEIDKMLNLLNQKKEEK